MPDSINNERFRKLLFSYPGKAIQFLYDLYYHSLINISERLTHNRKASEDIVQETFIHVWEKHELLSQQHDSSIQYYLVRVVKNKSISFYKKDMRLIESRKKYLHGSTFNPVEYSAEANIIALEVHKEIRRVISTFPRRERECFLMSVEEEMTNKQTAERLGISVKAVERSLTSANKRLKRYWLFAK